MEQEEFEKHVRTLEDYAMDKPESYRWRVIALTMLGDLYLVGVLLMLILITTISLVFIKSATVLAAKVLIVVVPLVWLLSRSLWVKVPKPDGIVVTRSDAPALFDLIDSLQRALDAPRFHRVLINGEFNAGVIQRPRLGAFGWYENYLLIGIPLLKTMSADQFKAALAHEYGHLAGGHAKLSNWIYRQRLRWTRLLELFELSGRGGGVLFDGFLKRYVPFLNAYSFPLARSNEYQADAVAVRLTSKEHLAQALTAVNTCGNYLSDQFWSGIYKHADTFEKPQLSPFSELSDHFASSRSRLPLQEWVAQAMQSETTYDDTHPALADRLSAINAEPSLILPEQAHAADTLLGPSRANIAARLDELWRLSIGPQWTARFEEVRQNRNNLEALESRASAGELLPTHERFQYALLVEDVLHDTERALGLMRELFIAEPENPDIAYALGTRLLRRKDSEGLALVETAIARDPRYEAMGRQSIVVYLEQQGDAEGAVVAAQQASRAFELRSRAAEERARISTDDEFLPHGVNPEVLAPVVGQLRQIKTLLDAVLVQKACVIFPDERCYVLGVISDVPLFDNKAEVIRQTITAVQSSVDFPFPVNIFPLDNVHTDLKDRLRSFDGARILDRV